MFQLKLFHVLLLTLAGVLTIYHFAAVSRARSEGRDEVRREVRLKQAEANTAFLEKRLTLQEAISSSAEEDALAAEQALTRIRKRAQAADQAFSAAAAALNLDASCVAPPDFVRATNGAAR